MSTGPPLFSLVESKGTTRVKENTRGQGGGMAGLGRIFRVRGGLRQTGGMRGNRYLLQLSQQQADRRAVCVRYVPEADLIFRETYGYRSKVPSKDNGWTHDETDVGRIEMSPRFVSDNVGKLGLGPTMASSLGLGVYC